MSNTIKKEEILSEPENYMAMWTIQIPMRDEDGNVENEKFHMKSNVPGVLKMMRAELYDEGQDNLSSEALLGEFLTRKADSQVIEYIVVDGNRRPIRFIEKF